MSLVNLMTPEGYDCQSSHVIAVCYKEQTMNVSLNEEMDQQLVTAALEYIESNNGIEYVTETCEKLSLEAKTNEMHKFLFTFVVEPRDLINSNGEY